MSQPEVGQACPRHPGQVTHCLCGKCGKPMCRQCQSQFGYFCSAECRGAARAVVTEAERAEAAAEKAEFAHRAKIARTIVSVGVGLFLLLVAFVVWRLFLNPAGKVCWQWDCAPDKPKSAQILTADAGRVLVRLGRKVVSLDPKTGKVVQTLDLESAPATGTATAPETAADGEGGDEDEEEDSGGYSAFLNQVRPVPNGFVETSSDTIARYDAAGKQSARKSYPMGRISHLALSQDGTKAWYAAEQPADLAAAKKARAELTGFNKRNYEERLSDADQAKLTAIYKVLEAKVCRMVGLDLTTGSELWGKTLAEGVSAGNSAAGDQVLALAMTRLPQAENEKPKTTITALRLDSGKLSWQTELPESPEWGPVAAAGMVLFRLESEIHALTEDGKEKYTIPVDPKEFNSAEVREGCLFLFTDSSCKCYDLASGAVLWEQPIITSSAGVVVTAKHVFLHGMPARGGGGKDAKLPEQYGDIGKEMSDMIAKAGKRAPPTLVAVDRATRQALWQVAPVYGHVLANDAVTMAVSDTAETGMMTMLAGGKGELIVRRFNLRNGKNLYQRTSELGFREPVLAGDRAVGLVYERLEQAGLLSGGDGGSSRAPQFLGLAAIRAR